MKINFNKKEMLDKFTPKDNKSIEKMVQVMLDDGNEYAPYAEGTLRDSTAIEVLSSVHAKGSWNTPYARFLHEGKVMVGKDSRSPWAKKGETKVVTGENLEFSKDRNPNAQSKWTVISKIKNIENWEKQWKKLISKE